VLASWRSESFWQRETRKLYKNQCLQRLTKVGELTKVDDQAVYSKSVTVIRNELFYRSKSVLVRPNFLTKKFCVHFRFTKCYVRFDSSSLCLGCDPKFGEQLVTMKSVTQGKLKWLSKRCLKVLERGSTCHFVSISTSYCHLSNNL
jgi:hypothetical protein